MALIDGLQGYWKFDEASGNASDAKNNGNTLTNNNTVTYGAGKINNGANFASASSQYFEIANGSQSGLGGGSDLTVAGWVKFTNFTGFNGIMSKRTGNSAVYSFFSSTTGPKLGSYDGSTEVRGSTTLSSGTWYHVAFVYDNTAHTVTFYLNGSSDGSGSQTFTTDTSAVRIGAASTAGDFMNGSIDELGFWSRKLSASEISQLYNGGNGLSFSEFGSNTGSFNFV